MRCMICDGPTAYYFSKRYDGAYAAFMTDLPSVDYAICGACGFVFSLTHQALDAQRWSRLNFEFHDYCAKVPYDQRPNSPPYAEQALMLGLAATGGIIDASSMLDYAGGRGILSCLVADLFGMRLAVYEPYVRAEGISYLDKGELTTYKVVFNSAMFEHVLCRQDLDEVNDLVDRDGVLIVHTVVGERVPQDPSWFYLRPPVHTAFHTNRSMEILMEQWGYTCSIYSPKAKSWMLLRDDVSRVIAQVDAINRRLKTTWFIAKPGFVDYWK